LERYVEVVEVVDVERRGLFSSMDRDRFGDDVDEGDIV